MAKRYMSFSDLAGFSGEYKPGGTLGRHNCNVVPQGDRVVVIGSAGGRVTLREGDTLGYDCGNVWLVPRPNSYRDPIRRVLALAKISQKMLEYSDQPVRYSVSYGRSLSSSCADTETGSRPRAILGDHTDQEVTGTDYQSPDQGDYQGGFGFEREVIGGDCIIVQSVASFEATTSSRGRRVSQVIVRTKVDKIKVAKWLEEQLNVGAARERREAEANQKTRWFEEDYKAGTEMFEKIVQTFNINLLKEVLLHGTFPYTEKTGLAESISWQEKEGPAWSTMSWTVQPYEDRQAVVTLNGQGFRPYTKDGYMPFEFLDMHAICVDGHEKDCIVGLYRTGRLQRWLSSLEPQQ